MRELLTLEEGSLVTTVKPSAEPLDLSLDGEIFARAEATVVNDKLWARLTKIVGGKL